MEWNEFRAKRKHFTGSVKPSRMTTRITMQEAGFQCPALSLSESNGPEGVRTPDLPTASSLRIVKAPRS